MKPIRIGVVMDPIATINPKKDSTLAILLEAEGRGWAISYIEQRDLYLRDGRPHASMRALRVRDDLQSWFELADEAREEPLDALQVVLMRKDPPFDMEYIYTTYLLELAEAAGVVVSNSPGGLRDANEKIFAAWFPQCTPPTLVTRGVERLRGFLAEQGDIVVKPLDAMGGRSIFRLRQGDDNVSVTLETMTQFGTRFTMAQRYLPEITEGDKRMILIDGEPIPHLLTRVPQKGDIRGNLAAGAAGLAGTPSERDLWICRQVGPRLKEKGFHFVGIDIIGDYLTEINVTSPTGIRELDRLFDLNIARTLLDALEARVARR